MRASDALWPVLLLTTLVLGSGGALEAYSRSHEAGGVVIAVVGEAALPSTSPDDTDDADDDGPETSTPISESHGLARALARRGELPQALALLTKVTADAPNALGPKLDLGYWLRRSGRVSESLAILEQARESTPDSASAAYQLAASQRAAGNTEAAEASYEAALALRPNHGPSLLALANSLRKRGALDRALSLLERAASSGGNSERAVASLALGRTRLVAGQWERGLAAFKRSIDYSPADPSIRLSIAKACLASGQKQLYPEARAQAERAAQLAPDSALVVALLGWVRERGGDREGARAAYQSALQIDPNQDYAERKLLHLALGSQDLRAARRHAEHLVLRLPDVPEHDFLLALVASREGNLEEARSHYRSAIGQAKGRYPEAYFNLGRLEKAAGNFDAAVAAYQKALELKPVYPEALNNLGLLFGAAGKPESARSAWREALRLDDRYAPAWVNLGELSATGRDFAGAEEAFAKAIALRPQLVSALLGLARAKRDQNRVVDAIASYRALLAQHQRNARAWFELAELLERKADLRGAADAATKASALSPENAEFLFKRADMLSKVGDLEAARSAFDELIDGEPGFQAARLGLAELLHRMGDDLGCAREARRIVGSSSSPARARELVTLCTKT